MLHVTAMPMPGVLRLRALHPLIEGDGSCGLVYDLERAAVVEVPEELQFHVAPALETGDLDEALVGWLVSEDLLTGVGGMGWSGAGSAAGPPEAAGWWSPGTVYWIDDELHARVDPAREESALELIAFALEQSPGHGRVRIHLSWGGSYPGNGRLERIVVETFRLAGPARPEVCFELTLDAGEVTPARADFLAGHSFQVRLLCGSYPAPRQGQGFHACLPSRRDAWKAEGPVRLLLDRLGDRLTVHCVLDQGRLLDLWEWAKQTGVRHLDATILADSMVAAGEGNPGRRREVRNDLMAVCDEMADALAAQHLPVDYEPLTRIVDRLMRSEPLISPYGEHGGSGLVPLVPIADAYPRSFLDSLDLRPPGFWGAGEGASGAEMDTPELPCRGCWARHACSHSAYVASMHDADEPWEVSEDRCSLWRTEVEVALRFYHRLAHTDPLQVRKFFDEASREPAPLLGLREEPGPLRMPS